VAHGGCWRRRNIASWTTEKKKDDFLLFFPFLSSLFSLRFAQISSYLQGMKKEHMIFIGHESWPLILIDGQKSPSLVTKAGQGQ
jgi:hypothetical protein